MSILGNSSNVVIDNAKLSNAGRDVRTTTQHANSAFSSSSDQVIVMDKPNVINAGGNITYITWNFQLLEMATAALSLAFSPFRTRAKMAEPWMTLEEESPDVSLQNKITTGLAELDIGVAMFPKHDEGNLAIRNVESVLSKSYIESMIQLGIGYPMWNPQPDSDLPLTYRRSGISIGDLGVITDDGDFDFLFNVLLRAKDAVNLPADLPDDFDTPQRPKVTSSRRKLYTDANNLSNLQNIRTEFNQHSKDISFLCKDKAAGAILVLPHGASENDLKNKRHWMTFISENALSWYKYARDNCGRDLDRHSLYLITGHTKSKAWGLVTFNTPVSERNDVLVMGKSTSADAPPYIWKEFGGASIHRSGPTVDRELINEVGDSDIENQCVFLRGFKISLSEQTWNELWDVTAIDVTNKDGQSPEEKHSSSRDGNSKGKEKDKSGSHSSSQGNLGNSVSLSNFPTRNIPFHPSNKINDLLLSLVPDAQIAVTHDHLWMDVVQSKDHEKEEMLAATFGSNYVASYYKDTAMCTFEPIKELIPTLKQAGSLSEDNIDLFESLSYMLKGWASSGSSSVADCVELCINVLMGQQQSETLAIMDELALKYSEQHNWTETEDIQMEILEIRAKTLGKEHPDTLIGMNNLALTYQKQGNWEEAEKMHIQIFEIRTCTMGAEHPETLDSMNKLSVTYFEQAKWTETEFIQNNILEICTRVLGRDHPDTIASMNNLSSTYYEQGKFAEVENIQKQVLDTRIRILGNEHPDTLSSMNNLAVTYYEQRKYNEAEDIQMQVLEIRTRILGEEHSATLSSMNNLALAYFKQDKFTEAVNIQTRVLEIRTRTLGVEHPDALDSMNNLAAIYHKQCMWVAAESLVRQVLEMRIRILGEEHPDTLTSMYNQAIAYYEQGRWTDAENLQSQVLEMRTHVLGKEHPDTLASMHNLALTYDKLGKWTDAEDLRRQVLEMCPRISGKEHPETLFSFGRAHDVAWLLEPNALTTENHSTLIRNNPNKKSSKIASEVTSKNTGSEHRGSASSGRKDLNTLFTAQNPPGYTTRVAVGEEEKIELLY